MIKNTIFPSVMLVPTLLFPILTWAAQPNQSDVYVAAELSENLNSNKVKEVYNASRLEGWVFMNYVVGTDGLPKDIEVVDRSAKGYNLKVAADYVKNYRFNPATFNGKPVESTKTLFFTHTISFYGTNNEGITLGFSNRYEKAEQFIRAKQLDKAKQALDEITESNSKNLTEQALNAWMHSYYYQQLRDWDNYGQAIQAAERLRQYLPTKMAISNSQNLLSYHGFKQQYGEAVYTAYGMRQIEHAELDDQTLETMLKPLLSKINGTEDIVVKANLRQDLAWTLKLVRNKFKVNVSQGKLIRAQLRCANRVQTLDLANINQWTMEPQDLRCTLLLKGEPGTTVEVTKQGQAKGF